MSDKKLVPAYQKMMDRVQNDLTQTQTKTLGQHIDAAKEKAVELEELTIEEAEKVSDYLLRDVQDAAEYIVSTEQELADWLKFDIELIEERLLGMLNLMVDHTRQELTNLAENARQATEWCTGEITGPGTLYCVACGKKLVFKKPDYIPICDNCGAILFKREFDDNE